jgi:hypothetical protein
VPPCWQATAARPSNPALQDVITTPVSGEVNVTVTTSSGSAVLRLSATENVGSVGFGDGGDGGGASTVNV